MRISPTTVTPGACGATRASAASLPRCWTGAAMTDKPAPPAPPPTLAAALAELQTRLPYIGKESEAVMPGKNGGRPWGYKYADLATISREVLPLLGELGLAFTARPTMSVRHEGKDECVVACKLLHVAGEDLAGEYPLPQSGSPESIGSAITYARRYTLLAVTGAAPDEDDDDAQSAEQGARAQRNMPPEVRADGSATEAEQSRMSRGSEPGAERAASVPADDPWYDQRPADVLPEELPGQRQDIYIAMSKRDITTPDARREAIERLTGRQMAAAKDMSFNEAAMVHAAVKGWDGRTAALLGPLAAERSKADA